MSTTRCPICGAEDVHQAFLCGSCGADLSLVTSLAVTTPAATPAPPASAPSTQPARHCPRCGAANEAWALLCVQCAGDLSAATAASPTVLAEPPASPPELHLVIQERAYPCAPGDVLGREGTVAAEAIAAFGTVHRRHAQLRWESGRWHVTALSAARNLTELDGRPLAPGQSAPLTGEHVLRLSTQFTAQLKVQAATTPSTDAGKKE